MNAQIYRRSVPILPHPKDPNHSETLDALEQVNRFLAISAEQLAAAYIEVERKRRQPTVKPSNGDEARPATMTFRELVTDDNGKICELCGEAEGSPHKITCPGYVCRGGFMGMYDGLD